MNEDLNTLNLKTLISLSEKALTLDYDNILMFNSKADSTNTYKKAYGYYADLGIIGNHVIYIENRNGNSNPRTLQDETLTRMFKLLDVQQIKIKAFRADSTSYLYNVLRLVEKKSDYFYIKARMNAAVARAINDIECWEKIETATDTIYLGEIQ
ncbi:MAG: hypothetical protein ABJL44_20005 [Algibacter sp.]